MSSNLTALKQAVAQARRKVTGHTPAPQVKEEERLRRDLQAALDAWQYAENHFREATDQDLIDQATYDLLSAKARYTYLLKQARGRGVQP